MLVVPRKNTGALGVFLFALAMLCIAPASAMTVTPLVLEMSTAGPSSKSSLRVTNDGATPLPVEIKISRLELDDQGEGKQTAAGKEFLVFPPQAMVPPGSSQTFRVQWVGQGNIEKSQSFIFAINQLPVKFPNAQSGVQIVFNFAVIVNVAPPTATSSITLKGVAVTTDNQGIKRPVITVANSGNRHASLGDATLFLASGGWSQTVTSATMRQLLGVGLVQPGRQRRFVLATQLPAQVKDLTGRLDYQPPRPGSATQ